MYAHLITGLVGLTLLASPAWADPDKDESGKHRYKERAKAFKEWEKEHSKRRREWEKDREERWREEQKWLRKDGPRGDWRHDQPRYEDRWHSRYDRWYDGRRFSDRWRHGHEWDNRGPRAPYYRYGYPRPGYGRYFDDRRYGDFRRYDRDDDDLDAIYTPWGYYEDYPEYEQHRFGREGHGRVGPFRFEVWR